MAFKQFVIFNICMLCVVSNYLNAQLANNTVSLPQLASREEKWVDSVYQSLSMDDKIAQLFMVAAYSAGEKYNQPMIEKLIEEYKIGGLIFMQGNAPAQAMQTNIYQRISKVPLLIAMDAEWGLGMRLENIQNFPKQIMLGAMHDSTLVYKMGAAIAYQCQRLGVHINFAPVVDVNNNPNNPVINFRSFGENKYKVANFAIQYMRGLQDNLIIACAKHFPGHGDTDVDSHKDLPVIKKTTNQLDETELYPFKKLIANGIQSIMVAHLQVPALDNVENTPTTLSTKAVTTLLKQKMGFNGLIFTDALNMQGVAKYYPNGEIDYKAFLAGNDVLLFSQDVPKGIARIKKAIKEKEISEKRLEESVKKILTAKYNVVLPNLKVIDTTHITEDINQYTSVLRTQIASQSLTLLSDSYQLLYKIKTNKTTKISYVGIGTQKENSFSESLTRYGVNTHYFNPKDQKELALLQKKIKNDDVVIIGVHNMLGYPTQNFGIDTFKQYCINTIKENKKTLLILFGNPYAVKYFCNADGLIVAYDDTPETQAIAAQFVMGSQKANGTIPVSVCKYEAGTGITSLTNLLGEPKDTIQYKKQTSAITSPVLIPSLLQCCVNPSALSINENELDKIDQIVNAAIQSNALPGCRVLLAKEGKVFYDKAFGYLTYDKRNNVDLNTIYDIASLTKVCATTLAIMKLYDEGQIDLQATLGTYLPMVRNTDKQYLKIKDILLHQAGLKSWIPFYKETLDTTNHPKPEIYSTSPQRNYSIKVAQNLYMNRNWVDTMWNRILYSDLENRGKYVYSDLDFLFLQKVIERKTGMPLDDYLKKNFYLPLGLKSTAYLPQKNLAGKEIAPTEVDNYFRYQTINGNVHDMGAAMFGGVCGHAGLFSTANDIAVIFQMLLNGGEYNGKRYLKESTVKLFTAKNSFISRRGLGFDKPEMNKAKSNPCSNNTPACTFGHTGFTGTCVWADPDNQFLFVFLSNRTYPKAENKLINALNLRERIQKTAYDALGIAPNQKK